MRSVEKDYRQISCNLHGFVVMSAVSSLSFRGPFCGPHPGMERVRGCGGYGNDSLANERNHDEEVPTDDEEVPMADRSGTACCRCYLFGCTGSGQREVGTHGQL